MAEAAQPGTDDPSHGSDHGRRAELATVELGATFEVQVELDEDVHRDLKGHLERNAGHQCDDHWGQHPAEHPCHGHPGGGQEVRDGGRVEEGQRQRHQEFQQQLHRRGDDHQFGILDFDAEVLGGVPNPMRVLARYPQIAGRVVDVLLHRIDEGLLRLALDTLSDRLDGVGQQRTGGKDGIAELAIGRG